MEITGHRLYGCHEHIIQYLYGSYSMAMLYLIRSSEL